MSKAIQKVSNEVELLSDNIQVVPYGLKFNAELDRGEWSDAFLKLQHAGTVYQWYLGDLVAQADWQWKGEMYDMMMDVTGLDRETLQHYSIVARAFPADIRKFVYETVFEHGGANTKLSYTYFDRLASMANSDMEKAVDFLIRAGREGWTIATLREKIAASKGKSTTKEQDEDVIGFKETTKPYFTRLMHLVEIKPYETEQEFLEEVKYAVETRLATLEKEGE